MQFKPIKDWEDRYEINTTGQVRSIRTGKIIAWITNTGYAKVQLIGADNVRKYPFVHRLVAQAFLPNPKNLPVVHHLDENPMNNNVRNLEWCTIQHNNTTGTRMQRATRTRKDNSVYDYVQYTKSGELIKRHTSITDAAEALGCSFNNVMDAARGKQKTCKGYIIREELKRNEL